MKLLTLLPEEWKTEIDYTKADVLIVGHNTFLRHEDEYENIQYLDQDCDTLERSEVKDITAAYVMNGTGLSEIHPEPRPDDSIKLSECDGRHLVSFDGINKGKVWKAIYICPAWICINSEGRQKGRFRTLLGLISDACKDNGESIRIYDMEQEQ